MRGLIFGKRQLKRWGSSLTPVLVPTLSGRPARSESGAQMDFASPSRTQIQITAMLRAWSGGKEPAPDELIHAVYHELRRQARMAQRLLELTLL